MLYDESLTRPKSRKLGIFLAFIFIFFSLLLFLWGYKYYKDAVKTTDKSIESTNCWAYSYTLKNIRYQDSTLSFELENRKYSDGRIYKITIITEDEIKEVEFPAISQGMSRTVEVKDIIIDGKFMAFIENCEDLIKEYSL